MLHAKFQALLFALLIIVSSEITFGQGCSDAGICTLNGLKPEDSDSVATAVKNTLRIGVSYGRADHQIQVAGGYIDYTRALTNRWETGIKITSLGQFGNGISVFNVSDVYLTGLYSTNNSWKFTIGMKVPLNNGNSQQNGKPLPMDYQSSLGTVDAIGGAFYQFRKWKFQIGVQQPLVQNSNTFQPQFYSVTDSLSRFVNTNHFKRKADALLRVSRTFPVGKRIKLTPGLLGIYHFGEDSYVDSTGATLPIVGSSGPTVNGTLFIDYKLSEKQALQFNFGTPFIVRDIRPDGLTRSLVIALEYIIQF